MNPSAVRDRNRTLLRRLVDTFTVLLVIIGFVAVGYVLLHVGRSPLPQPTPASDYATTGVTAPPRSALPSSLPTRLTIPAIGAQSALTEVGLNADGTPGVPSGATVDEAAWLKTSVTPGQTGTSIIVGHVDTLKSGSSVFYRIGRLAPGTLIRVQRQDGKTAVFTVTAVRSYDKTAFPSALVYGQSGTPVLRLITCSGDWDAQSHQYTQNLVVFSSLTSVE
ncbi:MAG TPA: class F sortase [Candidatus Saccharimonadales bacterium]|nr:class F sortase [Candidatus Saccharimonadales bacterium]